MAEVTWKLYSPLCAEFFLKDEYGDIDFHEENAIPFSGTDLILYEDSIHEEIDRYGGPDDLAEYIHDDCGAEYGVQINQIVLSVVPSVESVNGELVGCATVKLREPLTREETAALCSYLEGQYSDGWGEGFEQREIMAEDGALYVHFWGSEHFAFTINKQPTAEPEKTAEQDVSQPQRPKMNLVGMDSNIFLILGTASRLLRGAGQAEQAKEMEQRVQQSHDYYKALGIISEYVETELSHAVQANREKPEQKKGGEAR